MKIYNVYVKTHNKRERDFVFIISSRINFCRHYLKNDIFDKDTPLHIKRELIEIRHLIESLFYLNLINQFDYKLILDSINDEFANV